MTFHFTSLKEKKPIYWRNTKKLSRVHWEPCYLHYVNKPAALASPGSLLETQVRPHLRLGWSRILNNIQSDSCAQVNLRSTGLRGSWTESCLNPSCLPLWMRTGCWQCQVNGSFWSMSGQCWYTCLQGKDDWWRRTYFPGEFLMRTT